MTGSETEWLALMLHEIYRQPICRKDQKSGTEEGRVRGLGGQEAWTFSLAPNNVQYLLWSLAKHVSGGADEMPEQQSSVNCVPLCRELFDVSVLLRLWESFLWWKAKLFSPRWVHRAIRPLRYKDLKQYPTPCVWEIGSFISLSMAWQEHHNPSTCPKWILHPSSLSVST